MIRAGAVLAPLHRHTGEARFRKAMDIQFAPLKTFPRTRSGNYWHKARYPHQVWLDGLYMGQPFQLDYARITGNTDLFDDTLRQIRTVEQRMRQPGTGLYYHGWDESRQQRWADPKTGLSPHVWGRAMGWWLCALVDGYEASEGFAPEGRAEIAHILKAALDAMLSMRSPNGLWYQIVDQGARAGNYEEASASLMTTYALLKSARLGITGDATRRAGLQSLSACINRFLTPVALNGICRVAGLGGDPYRDGSYEYYLSEKIVANDPKGVGPFFMAVAEAVHPA
jgi:unsaturated rhamnogalacturonyl hydrolase